MTEETAVASGGGVIQVALSALIMLPDNQIREQTNRRTVKRYAELMRGGEVFDPVTVVMTEDTNEARGYILVDGWHRVSATQMIGNRSVRAIVVKAAPEEILWLAVEANRRHGLPLSRADKRNAFRAYVRAKKHRTGRGSAVKSSRQMEKDLNGFVTRHTLPVWMKADFPAIYAAMVGNGLEGEEDQGGVKPINSDKDYAMAAIASLDECMACARAINDTRVGREVLEAAVARVTEMAQAVTGKRAWPAVKTEIDAGF